MLESADGLVPWVALGAATAGEAAAGVLLLAPVLMVPFPDAGVL